MTTALRIALYAAGALAGVYLVNELRPVQLDPAGAVHAAGAGIDTALAQLFQGNFSSAWQGVTGGAAAAGAQAKDQVQGQVRANVVLGVVAGCVVAGVADMLVLS